MRRTVATILTLCVLSLGTSFIAAPVVHAEPSYTINYQGKLTTPTGVAVADGTYTMEFKLYTVSSGGIAIWTETRNGGNQVTVQNGLFSVMLGSVTSLTSVNFNQPLYLGVNINGDGEMTPRKVIGSVPSAFEAKQLGGVASSSFLRSDQADTAGSLLTFNGGLISNSSSTLARLSFTNATGTSLFIGGDRITDFVGSGLTLSGSTLTATLGTDITAGEIANGDHGFFSYSGGVASLDTGGLTSANLSAALTDETGTGGTFVLSTSPTLTTPRIATIFGGTGVSSNLSLRGTANDTPTNSYISFDFGGSGGREAMRILQTGNIGIGTTTPSQRFTVGATTTNQFLVSNSGVISDGTWQGDVIADTYLSDTLTIGAGSTFANNIITPNSILTAGQTDEYCLTYEGTGTTFEWQVCAAAGLASTDIDTSAEIAAIVGDETGSGALVFATSPTLVTPNLGTPSALTLTNATGLPISGLTGLGTNVGTFLATPSSLNLRSALTDETGTGVAVFNNEPTFVDTGGVGGGTITLGASGMMISTDGDGAISFFGLGDGFDENLTLNLDDTANTGVYTSASGLNLINFSGIALQESGSNILSVADTDTSAELAAILTDETGTGALVFGTAPTFTTSITSPLIYGGTAASSQLILRSTSGSGTTDDIIMGIGTNGGTQAFRIDNENNSVMLGELAGETFTSNTTQNIAIGQQAGRYASTTNAFDNVYIGQSAGRNNISFQNNFIGNSAGFSNRGSANNFIGYSAGAFNRGTTNNFIGVDAGYGNTGDYNQFIGYRSGYRNNGDYNEFLGYESGRYLNSTSTIVIGAQALSGTTNFDAVNNVALGYRAGYVAATGADNNILIGYQAADNLTTGNNNIIIGYDIDNVTATADNRLNIGNLIFGTGLDGTGTTLSSGNIGIGTSTPDQRLSVFGTNAQGLFTESGSEFLRVGVSETNNIMGIGWANGDSLTFGVYDNPTDTSITRAFRILGTGDGYISNGKLFASSGTVGSPAFGFENDIDTGFYNPGDGVVRFSSNNSDVFSIVSGGNVGIGTTSPASKLSVAGDLRVTGAFRDSSGDAGTNGQVLLSTVTGTNWVATSSLGISGGSSFTNSAQLAALLSDETGTGRSVFSISPAFSGTPTFAALTASSTLTLSGSAANIALGSNWLSGDGDDEGVFVDFDGDVGIGTNSLSSAKFVVNNSGAQIMRLTSSGTTGWMEFYEGASQRAIMGYGDSGNIFTGAINDSLAISGNTGVHLGIISTPVITIDSSFNVGIGDVSPDAQLDIDSTLTSGTIFGSAAPSSVTLAGALIGYNLDLRTNYTVTDQSMTGIRAQFPNITNNVLGTYDYNLLSLGTSGATLTRNTASGVTNFKGINILTPNITQTTGNVTADGLNISLGSITTGGQQRGINIISSGAAAGTVNGININGIASGAGTENAINIGSGWDTGIYSQSSINIDGQAVSGTNTTNIFSTLGDSSTVANTTTGISIDVSDSGILTTGTDRTYGQYLSADRSNSTGGTVLTYGQRIDTFSSNGGAGTATVYGQYIDTSVAGTNLADTTYGQYIIGNAAAGSTVYGQYIDAGGGAGTEYAAVFMNGNVGIADSSPSALFTVGSGDLFTIDSSGIITSSNNITPNSIKSAGQVDEYCLTYEGTGTTFEWQTCGGGGGLASTDIDTSSELAAILTDETGTGALVFGTAPTFTTSITSPLIYGGTSASSQLILRSTSGTGTTDDIIMGVGTNGATQAFRIDNENISVMLGRLAGETFVSGSIRNVALGDEAGRFASSTNADQNVYIGYQAGLSNVGFDNNLIGQNAGRINTGFNNNFFGGEAGRNNTGNNNNFLGYQAGSNNTGSDNIGIGQGAGYRNIGSRNEMLGQYAGYFLQASNTVAIGSESLFGSHFTTYQSNNNVALGYRAGYASANGSGSNILIGYRAADNLSTGNNNIIIGYDIDNVTATADNRLNIGNLIFGTGLDGTGTTLASGNVGIGDTTPDAKFDIDFTNSAGGSVYASYLTAIDTSSSGGNIIGNTINLTRTGTSGSNSAQTYGQYINFSSTPAGGFTGSSINAALEIDAYASLLGTSNLRGVDVDVSAADELKAFTGFVAAGGSANAYGLDLTFSDDSTVGNVIYGSYTNVADSGVVTSGTDETFGAAYYLAKNNNASSDVEMTGILLDVYSNGGSATNITKGLDITVSGDVDGTSTVYGLYVDVGNADTNYSGIFTGGNFGIGDTTPSALFTVGSGDLFTIDSSGIITSSNNITPNSIKSAGQVDEYCLTYEGTGTTFEWQTCGSGGGLTSTDIDTSSELAAILTDETGTGALVFGTAPTFTTSITSPLIYGGTAGSDQLILRSTSAGIGATTDDIIMGVGNNGAIQAFRIDNENSSISFGENAGLAFTSGTTNNIAIGLSAGDAASDSNADQNVYIGQAAGANNTNSQNVLIGLQAGQNNTGYDNVALGSLAGWNNTGGSSVFLGSHAGSDNTGNATVGIGNYAASNNSGFSNVALGYFSGRYNAGDWNEFLGENAGYKNTGDYNQFIGFDSGYNLRATTSTVIGAQAMRGGAGSTAYSAVNNVALGYRAGYAAQTGADNNILIGYQAADNLTTGNNNIIIGYDIDNITATADNSLNIGNLLFGTGLDGTGTTLASGNIGIGDTTPDAKLDLYSTQTSGTLIGYANDASVTLAGALTGLGLNLSTNYTATGQSVTGVNVALPSVSNAAGSSLLTGLTVTGGALTSSGSGSVLYTGAYITNPNITQTAGTAIAAGVAIGNGTITTNGVQTGVEITTATIATAGTQNGINVIAQGVGAGTLNAFVAGNITGGAGTENAINIGTGYDNILNSGVFTIAGSGASTIRPLTTFTTGTGISYAAAGATTLSGAYTGMDLNLSTNFTATGQSVTGINVSTPSVTNVVTSTFNYRGLTVTGGNITQTTTGGVNNFNGAFITNPNLTQTTGTLSANGVSVTTGTNTTGGTQQGFAVVAQGVAAGTLNAFLAGSITAGAGTENAINVGTGYDNILNTTPFDILGNGSTAITPLTTFTTGTGISYAASGATTLSGAYTGMNLNLATSFTATGQNVTGYSVTTPAVTNVAGTFTYRGLTVTGSAITSNNAGSTNTFTGAFITNSNLTQTTGSANANGVSVTTGTNTTGGTQQGFNVIGQGVTVGTLNALNIATITGGAGTENAINIGNGFDKILESQTFDIAGSGFTTINPLSTVTTGDVISLSYGIGVTLTGQYTGFNQNYTNFFTATNQSVTGYNTTLPTVTNTGAGTYNYRGETIGTAGTLTQQTAAGNSTFTGSFITNPNISLPGGGGSVTANGVSVTTGSITTAGTQTGFNVIAAGVGAGTLTGLNISAITAGAGTETGLNIGAGWDVGIQSSSRMTIASDIASNYAATFFNDGNATTRFGIQVQAGLDDNTAAGPSTLIQFADGDGTSIGSISFGSSVVAYNTTSDRRLKENIVDTNTGIEALMQLQVRDYNWKADADHSTLTQGFIAQELFEVYPQAVTVPTNPANYWMVDYSKLTPLIISAVQDQQAQINTLFTGSDSPFNLSEKYRTLDGAIEAGHIVSLVEDESATIKRAGRGEAILGVVSNEPGLLLNQSIVDGSPVAVSGHVAVKVNMEGGSINVGDAITLSSVRGVGTKATTTSDSIGIALEATSTPGTLKVYVRNQTYFSQSNQASLAQLFSTPENAVDENDTLWSRLATLASNFVDGVLSVTGVRTDELCVGDVCVDEDAFLEMVESAGAVQQPANSGGGTPEPEPTPEENPEPEPTPPPAPEPTPEPSPEPAP